jgi:hypothetical protein
MSSVTEERRLILGILRHAGGTLSTGDIVMQAGKGKTAVANLLNRL